MTFRLISVLKNIVIIAVILYGIACIGLYAFQEKLIFDPHVLATDEVLTASTELKFNVDKEVYLSAQLIKGTGNDDRGLVLYLHGNRGNVRRALYQSRSMVGHGEDLIVLDYRGYGSSQGEIESEEQMMNDVQLVYNELKQSYEESNITIVGYSLGTSMASYLAAHNDPKQLILVAPFTSMLDMKNRFAWMFPDFILKYKLQNVDFIKHIKCMTYILHGDADELIPVSMAYQLEKLNPKNVELIIAPTESHRSVIFSGELASLVQRVLD